MSNLAFVTYTHSNCKDIWRPYFDSLDTYASNIPSYVFSNEKTSEFINHKYLVYDDYKNYCEEFIRLLENVKEDYFIYMQEDFILYNYIDKDKIQNYIEILSKDENLSYVRLIKCGDVTSIKYKEDLFYISISGSSNNSINSFSMQPTIWKKKDFIKIYALTMSSRFGEGWQYTIAMNQLNINGLYSYNNEPKRGGHHDSYVFPYIATAVVRGKWNYSEYSEELKPIFTKYDIDCLKRGLI